MKKLKRDTGCYMLNETSYLYCGRHDLNFDNFFDEHYISGDIDEDELEKIWLITNILLTII